MRLSRAWPDWSCPLGVGKPEPTVSFPKRTVADSGELLPASVPPPRALGPAGADPGCEHALAIAAANRRAGTRTRILMRHLSSGFAGAASLRPDRRAGRVEFGGRATRGAGPAMNFLPGETARFSRHSREYTTSGPAEPARIVLSSGQGGSLWCHAPGPFRLRRLAVPGASFSVVNRRHSARSVVRGRWGRLRPSGRTRRLRRPRRQPRARSLRPRRARNPRSPRRWRRRSAWIAPAFLRGRLTALTGATRRRRSPR